MNTNTQTNTKKNPEQWDDVDEHLAARKTRGEVIGLGLLAVVGYGLLLLIKKAK